MAGFFPHVGGANVGFTPLALSTFSGVLNDIYNDIGAGVNGWSVHDDRRTDTTYLIPMSVAGLNGITNTNYVAVNTTSGSANVTWQNTNTNAFGRVYRSLHYGGPSTGTLLTWDNGSNYYNVQSSGANAYTFTLDRNFSQASQTTSRPQEKVDGYLVLKCTNATKNFYVAIFRPHCYGDALRVQVFEDWNATTHSGSNGGPMEILRAYENGWIRNSNTKIQYMLWLLPSVFALYTSSDPAESYGSSPVGTSAPLTNSGTFFADFFYAGHITPFRNGDTNAIMQACSNQEMSGLYGYPQGTGYQSSGPVAVLRNYVADSTWHDIFHYGTVSNQIESFPTKNRYMLWPRGRCYVNATSRNIVDDAGRFQFTDFELYHTPNQTTAFSDIEMKRGDVKYVRVPVSNPSLMDKVVLGGADDGNTYIIFRTSYPAGVASNATPTSEAQNAAIWAGGFHTNLFCNLNSQDITLGTNYAGCAYRYLAMPINL